MADAQKVVRAYGNFSNGQIDHDLMGRFDLPTYSSGMDVFQNFISNFKGNAIYSAGFISQLAFQNCAFVEFKFGITQNYLCCFFNSTLQFLAFTAQGTLGWVLNNSMTTLQVSSPYTLAEAQFFSVRGAYAQNDDVMYIAHRAHPPYKLTRTAANAFTLATYNRIADPFYAAEVATSTTSQAMGTGAQTYTIAAGKMFAAGAQIVITETSNTNNVMTGTVTSYSGTTLVVKITSVTGSGTFTDWTINQGINWPGAVAFYQGKLYFASSTSRLTDVWFSNGGQYDDFTIQNPLTDASGFAFTCSNITQQIEWLFPADYSLIAGATDGILVINGGAVNTAITPATVQALVTSAYPTNGVYPLKKDALVFYEGVISRNIFTIRYDILMQTFSSQDCNLESYDMTRGLLGKLRYKRDRNDLIFAQRGDGNLVSMVFKSEERINGWHLRTTQGTIVDIAQMGDLNGNPQLIALVVRPNGTYYVEVQASYVEFKKPADFWTQYPTNPSLNPNEDMDTEAWLRYVSEQSRQCNYLDNSMFFADLRSSTITFTQTGVDANGSPTGTLVSSANDFSSGSVGRHAVYKTATGYESGRYLITHFNSLTSVNVTAIQIPHGINNTPLLSWNSWYMSFLTVSGLSQYNGQAVGLVQDGGFNDAQVISGGTITLDKQTTSICVGYLYTGIIKSMCIGFQIQGSNTQVTEKEISRVMLRCVNSAGMKVGSSLYDLQEVQLRTQNDINYLPPAPIDGTQDIDVDSDSEEDFFFYIVQDLPLPATIASYFLEANYAMTT